MHRKLPAAAAIALISLALTARADDLVTKAGTTYTGKIVAEDDVTVTVDTPALGRLNLAKADLASIKRDAKDTPPAKGPDAPKQTGPAAPAPSPPQTGPSSAPPKPNDDAAKAAEQAAAEAAAKAAKAKADEEAAALLAEEREARRRASKIVRRTEPQAAKVPKAGVPAPVDETKATLGGAQLAKAERGSFVVVFLPPKQFEAAPSGIQIGRRFYARLDSAGSASAWLSLPMAAGDEQVLTRLTEVQRHVNVKMGASRLLRMIEGIDKGAWLRVRLDDGTSAQGVLQAAQENGVSLSRPKDDGSPEAVELAEDKIIEIDGLMRSTSTRLVLNELAAGEPVSLTLWPDGREVVGVLKERTELMLVVEGADGSLTRVAVDGPVAEARRVPAKWRAVVMAFTGKTVAHAKSGEDFPDSRVERDLVGGVAAVTAYALSLDTPDGVLVIPFEMISALGPAESDGEASAARSMKKSERSYRVPVRPGDAAEKAKDLDPALGVSVVTDGNIVRNVLVSAPFEGEVFGIHLGDRVDDAEDRTDLRFDTIVTPRRAGIADAKPSELISNSLERIRVTLMLDSAGSVSAIELGAR